MTDNIWIFCHYAQQPPYNTMLRYHNWGKELAKRNYNVSIISASTVHNTAIDMIEQLGSDNDIVDSVKYRYLKTPKYAGNGFYRIRNMMSFALQLLKLRSDKSKPDVIVVCEAYLYFFAKLFFPKTPIITDIVDLWPLSIVEYADVNPTNPIIKLLYFLEKWAYIKTDALVFSMEGGPNYVREQKYKSKINFDKVFHINMGIDIASSDKYLKQNKNSVDFDKDKENIVYIGSIRKANNIKQICDVALEIQQYPTLNNVFFHIFGNGDELEFLIEYCKKKSIKNIKFYGRILKEDIPVILSNSTANILTYKQVNLMKYGGSQSKLFDYLASAKPIICNAKFGYNLIERYNCGFVTENQSEEAFLDVIKKINSMDENELELMGKNARKTALDYDQPHLVDLFEDVLKFVNKRER
ncbi:glycosyltransferase family 4 protein [Streptococcus pseudoporcinus]|uniref:Glycosyltransferase, group 1 family protein n=1 Tax=Streptococcus pseudoporcinus LQ 940-04 TaxID=875093 RepID=G5KAI7_9STRE|nr:glycosyltransferase family 4 protein [Streptococcus pseudoporcinus]EHI64997.1 glycosyltransferase, group 1 family protein [Streptococcus pseudoporcinus LQ 940-04]VEF93069.1 capsular polysaccharide biosynthesis protein Cps4F [Streptococcus pseudoporcinus]